jgi:hypothetical protein
MVFQIGSGAKDNFGPFGTQQKNDIVAPATALDTLDANITLVGSVIGGDQGSVIVDGICYCAYGTNNQGIVAFDIETLEIIRQYETGNSYDASPLVVENIDGDLCILIHEDQNERTICRRVDDGSLVWVSGSQPGNTIFGLTYYESPVTTLFNRMTSTEILKALNDNFVALNSIIAGAATITTITSVIQWDDINDNIASLNAEGVTVGVETIVAGMTGQEFIDLINNFVIDYILAN